MKKKAQLTNVIIIITLALSAAAARGGVNSGTWSPTGSMSIGRFSFTATTLQNGKVLVAGGASNTVAALASAELYDPATGTWTVTGNMNQGRQQHSAILLRNGNVLVSGGNIDRTPCADLCVTTIAGSETYDPSTGQWTTVGEMTIPRSFFTTTLLPNGRVLATGGRVHTGPDYFDYKAIAWADLYDPTTRKWSATGP